MVVTDPLLPSPQSMDTFTVPVVAGHTKVLLALLPVEVRVVSTTITKLVSRGV